MTDHITAGDIVGFEEDYVTRLTLNKCYIVREIQTFDYLGVVALLKEVSEPTDESDIWEEVVGSPEIPVEIWKLGLI